MPRTSRAIEAGLIYHVLNRGNGRMQLFHEDADFVAFETVLAQALDRYPVDLLTYCLMGNHWHLVLRPRKDDALGRMMGWVGVTHVRRHHEHYHTRGGGHLYQGRFKSFPVQDDSHFLTLCRYVESNALRAGLVRSAARWPWCGLRARGEADHPLAGVAWPVRRPANWATLVDERLPEADVERLRASVGKGRPFGTDRWVSQTAARLGLDFTLRGPGRPRRTDNQ